MKTTFLCDSHVNARHVWEASCFLFFFSLWLRNNEPEATKKHSASLPRREELSRLKRELCHKFDLADIRYCTVTTLTLLSDVHWTPEIIWTFPRSFSNAPYENNKKLIQKKKKTAAPPLSPDNSGDVRVVVNTSEQRVCCCDVNVWKARESRDSIYLTYGTWLESVLWELLTNSVF